MRNLSYLGVIMLLVFLLVTLAFRIQPVKAIGAIYILSDGNIDPPSAPISTVDRITYTLTSNIIGQIIVERNNSIIDGAGHIVSGDGSGNGFELYSVSNVLVKNTVVQNFIYGFYVDSSSSIKIRENTITMNSYDGTGLFSVTSSLITGNDITLNGYDGIEMYTSVSVNITGNFIVSNGWYGIGAYDCSSVKIDGNRIADNYNGIEIFNSPETSIFHNDFINHTTQVSPLSTVATWDNGYPSGGNYWSDYTGMDLKSGPNQDQPGSDGIGDTNYTCTENNIDNYPLMHPWINIAVANVLPSKSNIGEGYKLYISVTVQNQGWNAQTTKLTVYVNTTVVGTVPSLALPGRSQAMLNFTWQTTPALKGNYVLRSTVDPVPNEPDVRDNNRTYGRIVKVTIVGDVNGDGVVDIYDAITLSNAFSSVPNSPTWNGNADINCDNSVDIFDAILLSVNFNKRI